MRERPMLDNSTIVERAGEKFGYLSYDDDTQLFLLDGNYIGFGFTCIPLSGFESSMEGRFASLLTHEYPKGSALQFCLSVFDDVGEHLDAIGHARSVSREPLIRAATQNTIRFLAAGAKGTGDLGMPVRHANLIISLKIPIEEMQPSADEITRATRLARETGEMLATVGFGDLRRLTDAELVHQLGIILNRYPTAGWRYGRRQPDAMQWLRDGILDYDTPMKIEEDCVRLGNTVVTSVSAKKFPRRTYFGAARSYSVDPYSGSRGIPCAHMISGTVVIQSINEARPSLERRGGVNKFYAQGPMGRINAEFGRRQADYDLVSNAMANGEFVHKISLTATLFSPNDEAATRNTAKAQTYLSELGLICHQDTCINFPLLRASLPMGFESTDVRDLGRYTTMNTAPLATFLPGFFEWRGTPTPLISLVGRGGQLMGWSPWDTDSNYNVTVSAESGAGKSFFSNELISAVLGTGGKVWVIDVGRSYLKLCESLGGQFLHFGQDSNICLNPFSSLKTDEEFEEVADILSHLLAAMAAPKEGLDDFQSSMLRTILAEQFKAHRDQLSIDHIAAAFFAAAADQEDGGLKEKRLSDVGHGLRVFRADGQYGKFFNGPANIDFRAPFVLLELEELKSQKHLQTIVLLLLIYQIQQGMYLGDRSIKKMMLIDEAWDLLSESQIASFIEAGYRRFRKYNGSAVVVTQSLMDLHGSDTGRAIIANSAHTIMLKQKDSTLNALAAGDNAEFSRQLADMLKTVHTAPGRYSEVYVKTAFGAGIGRFVVDPFRALLYSTAPKDVAAVEAYTKTGMPMKEAIDRVLADRRNASLRNSTALSTGRAA